MDFLLNRKPAGKLLLAIALAGIAPGASADNEEPADTMKINQLNDVVVSAVRAGDKTPMANSKISAKEFSSRNLGQDIPVLLGMMPSVVFTTDAGTGMGYTSMRVRGSDATRTNVTINGIPLNDSESNSVFWVNLGDFASGVSDMQLQRGVGTSTNGAAAFGASLNMQTDRVSTDPYGEAAVSLGSFNTRRYTAKFSTGLLGDKFEMSGRLSKLDTDGYIDRAWADLFSYSLSGVYLGKNTLVKLLGFGGKQTTYQAWNGLWAPLLDTDRKFNSAGAILRPGADKDYFTREDVIGYYKNHVDHYAQDHLQAHITQVFSPEWSASLSLHYTNGRGYYENYKNQDKFSKYGLTAPEGVNKSDFVTRKSMRNDFYGAVFNLSRKVRKLDMTLGGGWNQYDGDHYGNVLWCKNMTLPVDTYEYYLNNSLKTDFNVFFKVYYRPVDKVSIFADVQYRNIRYRMTGQSDDQDANGDFYRLDLNDRFNFFNPKAGVNFDITPSQRVYLSYARSNKEPNRSDYNDNLGGKKPTYETLDDVEAGWAYTRPKVALGANLYYMYYTNQLIPTGAVSDVGYLIRENAGKSYRMGIELTWNYSPVKWFSWSGNGTLSRNTVLDYKAITYDADWNEQVTEFGDREIAFSPSVVAANVFTFRPVGGLTASLMTKYVGRQYLGNENYTEYKLDGYCVTDLNVSYRLGWFRFFKSTELSLLVNNLFDARYVSNGLAWGTEDVYYFPCAGINFLVGLNIRL